MVVVRLRERKRAEEYSEGERGSRREEKDATRKAGGGISKNRAVNVDRRTSSGEQVP